MRNQNLKYISLILILFLGFVKGYTQTTIEQRIIVASNSGQNGGIFSVDYQLKGTNLTFAKTLGSLNADIVYDSSAIRFINGSNWSEFVSNDSGYFKNIQSNNVEADNYRSVRIILTAPNVNNSVKTIGSPNGYDIENTYRTIVRINFIILDNSKTISLTIKDLTNQVGLFLNPNNNPNTFDISDQVLTNPEIIEGEPLPVILASFSSNVKGNNVKLNWTTTSERNNSGFKVERKKSNENSNWIESGFVKGAGSNSTTKNYSFEDKGLNSGKYNYRLKQIDNNGNFSFFALNGIVEIAVPSKFNLSQNYPNPFNPVTKIDYEIAKDSKVNLTVFDMLGREMVKLVSNEQKAGYYTVNLNGGNLSSGVYFYRLITSSEGKDNIITKKMNIIK